MIDESFDMHKFQQDINLESILRTSAEMWEMIRSKDVCELRLANLMAHIEAPARALHKVACGNSGRAAGGKYHHDASIHRTSHERTS